MLKTLMVFTVLLTTSCLKLAKEQASSVDTEKVSHKTFHGTMKIEQKKQYDISKYKNLDFDRLLIINENGSSYNLSKNSASKNQKIWFPKSGKTTISLFKNGSPILTEVLR